MSRIDTPYTYRVINLDLTNGLVDEHFPIHAESIYYHWGTSTLNVKLNAASNDSIKLRPKNKIDAPVSQIFISADARAETVQLFIANPKSIILGGGEVRVLTDAGYFNSVAQKSFIGARDQIAAVAQFSSVSFFNPLISNIVAVVNKFTLVSDDTTVELSSHIDPLGAHSHAYNKYVRVGAQSLTELHITRVNPIGNLGLFSYTLQANIPLDVNMIDYFIVAPGCGLLFQTLAVNKYIKCIIEFKEEPFIPE